MRKDSKKQLKRELVRQTDAGLIRLNLPNQSSEVKAYWKGYLYSVQRVAEIFEIPVERLTGVDFNRF